MSDGHERFEALAFSHVLGGLAAAEDADLRSHLRGCAPCRARVAELRELSSDLDAAARDEQRRRAASRRRDAGPDEGPDVPRTFARRLGRPLLVALAIACLPLAFWNLHLRSASDTYFSTAEERATTLEAIATGRLVEVVGPQGERGRVAIDAARVAVVLVGVGPLEPDERLVAWLGSTDADGVVGWRRTVLAVGPEQEVGVSTLLAREGAERLAISRERGLLGPGPAGVRLLDTMLDDGEAVAAG